MICLGLTVDSRNFLVRFYAVPGPPKYFQSLVAREWYYRRHRLRRRRRLLNEYYDKGCDLGGVRAAFSSSYQLPCDIFGGCKYCFASRDYP
jgi:hypothetical protein